MVTGRRKSERSTQQKFCSPGRPPVWQRENLCRFWRELVAGLSSKDAAVDQIVAHPISAWSRFNARSQPPVQRNGRSPRQNLQARLRLGEPLA